MSLFYMSYLQPVVIGGQSTVVGLFFIDDHFISSTYSVYFLTQPHSPDNRALARECKDVKIDRVYIGSCTGGKTEDFMAAAKVFLASVRIFFFFFFFLVGYIIYKHVCYQGKKVKVPIILVPATQKVMFQAILNKLNLSFHLCILKLFVFRSGWIYIAFHSQNPMEKLAHRYSKKLVVILR